MKLVKRIQSQSHQLRYKRSKHVRTSRRDINYMVAVDGSKQSLEAIEACESVAKDEDTIFLVHVFEPISAYIQSSTSWKFNSAEPNFEALKQIEQDTRDSLDIHLKENIPSYPQKYTMLFKEGPPPWTVCETCKENNIDYLFIGDRGLGGVRRVILGSLANYCVHYAPCSVVMIKDKERAALDFKKIH